MGQKRMRYFALALAAARSGPFRWRQGSAEHLRVVNLEQRSQW